MLYLSPLELIASAAASTMLLIALAYNLQLLVYVYFVVAAVPHLSEVLISYHVLPRMVIA